jgi:hypothetical protein
MEAMQSSAECLADCSPRREEAAKQRKFIGRVLAFLDQFTVAHNRAVHLVERFGVADKLPEQPLKVHAVGQRRLTVI